MGTLTSEPLYHPELKKMQLEASGALLILKPELVNHPDFRGWPYITLNSKDGALD